MKVFTSTDCEYCDMYHGLAHYFNFMHELARHSVEEDPPIWDAHICVVEAWDWVEVLKSGRGEVFGVLRELSLLITEWRPPVPKAVVSKGHCPVRWAVQ